MVKLIKMKYYNITILALVAALTLSCEKSHINDNLYDSSVYIINNGVQKTDTFFDVQGSDVVSVYTYCGGFYGGNPAVEIKLDEAALAKHNNESGEQLKLLPSECYSIDATVKNMKDKKATFQVTFNCEALKTLSEKDDYSDLQSYALPLSVSSKTEGIGNPRFDDIASTLLIPDMSQMGFSLDKAGTSSLDLDGITDDGTNYVLEYKLTTPVENKWDNGVEFNFNAPVEGAAYPTLPEGSYEVSSSSDAGFTSGVSEITYTVRIDKSKVPDLFYSLTASVKSDGGFKVVGESTSVINFMNARIYSQSDITITDCNSYKTDPNLILDGKTNTLWEAAYNSSHVGTTSLPFSITMQLKEAVNVVGIAITRRSGSYVKDLRGGYFDLSSDGTTYSKASEFDYGTTNSDMGPLVTACSSTNASYLKLWITKSNRKAIISIAEFNLLTR